MKRHEQVTASRDALGILLSLLLGFTLAIALPRYNLRRQLAVDEANAIGTNQLRAELLADPARGRIRNLLAEYVEARVASPRRRTTRPALLPC
ncbi:MAG TPA: hypothetical protein VKX25_18785 [Bryobacteraceae bacterium]|jgi:hypothetical protein|nr:hypothetical protein [Bryobacteraceae bacterium]